jgi:magnesium chelatase family protein
VTRYLSRISGPLLDRIDVQIEVPAVPIGELQQRSRGERSDDIGIRVSLARERMLTRQGKANALLEAQEVERFCSVCAEGRVLLGRAVSQLGLSARSYHRALKVARSIADLAAADEIAGAHVAEALGYRLRLNR